MLVKVRLALVATTLSFSGSLTAIADAPDVVEAAPEMNPSPPPNPMASPEPSVNTQQDTSLEQLESELLSDSSPVQQVKVWYGSVSAEYGNGFKEDSEPALSYAMDAGRTYSDSSIGISINVNHLLLLNPDDKELNLADPTLYRSGTLPHFIENRNLRSTLTLSLPVSEFSREEGIITALGWRLGDSFTFANESLTLATGVNARYQVNQYKTTRTVNSTGGRALPWYRFGASLALTYKVHQKSSLSASGSYSESHSEDDLTPPSHPYSVALQYSYSANEHWSAGFGYSQGSIADLYREPEFLIFDIEVSQYFVNLGYAF